MGSIENQIEVFVLISLEFFRWSLLAQALYQPITNEIHTLDRKERGAGILDRGWDVRAGNPQNIPE